MIKKTLLLAATAVGLATSGCTTYGDNTMQAASLGNTAPEGVIDPAMWRVSDEDTTIYMLGTFHILPPELVWRTDTIDNALAASTEVYYEVSDDLSDPAALQPLIGELAITPGQPTLAERVGEENATTIAAFVSDAGVPMEALNVMDSWFVGLLLSQVAGQKLGYDGLSGVEQTLREDIEARGIQIQGLETAREQLSHLDGLSPEQQNEWLIAGIDEIELFEEAMTRLRTGWERGDAEDLIDMFEEDTPLGSPQRMALLTNRNANWTETLAERMDAPGTVFVAVGLGHLIGEDSVVAMMRERGFTVERIDD